MSGAEPSGPGLFREEALEEHFSPTLEGSVLKLTPFWVRSLFWVVAGLVGFAALFAGLARLREYGEGPALVQVQGLRGLTVPVAGVVSAVRVQPGEAVRAGDVLVELDAAQERAELERIDREIRLQRVRYYTDLTDSGARQALAGLHSQRQLAQARLEQRTLRAPGSGTVGDVRVKQAQLLAPGDTALTLHGADATVELLALMPGHVRPQISPGDRMQVELDGFPYMFQSVEVGSVGNQLVGPAEVRRLLGPDSSDVVGLGGPAILVRARLPATEFRFEGKQYAYFAGMKGWARIPIRSETVLLSLFPMLRMAGADNE